MRIVVVTTYENMTEAMVQNFIAENVKNGMTENETKTLIAGLVLKRSDKDPESDALATTTWQIQPDPAPAAPRLILTDMPRRGEG